MNRGKPTSKKSLEIIFADQPEETEEVENGLYLEKEDVLLLSHALAAYTPKPDEEHLLSVLLEEFEEILAVGYGELPPEGK